MSTSERNQIQANDLIDIELLNRFQEQFCNASRIYLSCISLKEGVVTTTHGSKEEVKFLHTLISEANYMSAAVKVKESLVESVIEEPMAQDFLKMCAVSIPIGGKKQIIWVATAILEDKISDEDVIPEYMMKTTEERFYLSLEFLEYMTKLLFAVKLDELIAQDAMQKSVESEEHMQKQLSRSETMTQIVTMLESEKGFGKIVDIVLKKVCQCLHINHGILIREGVRDSGLDAICEYASKKEWYIMSEFQHIPKGNVPFFNGKPYVISSDTTLPEDFVSFFKKHDIKAAIFLPVDINEWTHMYLCFYEHEADRIWDLNDIKFISDTKRIIHSILSKRITQNSLASSYASLEQILDSVGCGIYAIDRNTREMLYTNRMFRTIFSNSCARGEYSESLFVPGREKALNDFEERYFPEEDRWLDIHKTTIKWVDGRRVHLGTVYDVTAKKLYQKKIENQANNDFLTGLYNRMRCELDLEQYIKQAEKTSVEGALLYIDLDDFKHINDALGHHYGDHLLKAISHNLQRINEIESTCYRMGGDEFIVIVADAREENLKKICNQIQEIFAKPWFLKGEDYYCTMSMGIARFPTDGNSVEDLIRKADMALFSAKREGKNRIEEYNDKEASAVYRRLDMEKNMRKATDDACNEFEVYYQPVICIEDGKRVCTGAEALVRWNSMEMGFVSPDDFIPLAEYLGLINPIGDHVLQKAAKRCKYWNDMGHPDYKVSVNLSVVQLLQNDIVQKVQNILEETRLNPKNLTLEVTESLAVNDMDRMKQILGQIKSLGVNVSLDDFGTGYSSLNHIREMPIDIIKIDRCFIQNVGEDEFSDAFVRMVTELAAAIGVKVCVEGVETDFQCDILSKMHISYIQGYFFGKPMKIEEFEKEYL